MVAGRPSDPLAAARVMARTRLVRVTRGSANAIWAREFVLAARASGKGGFRITIEHVLPNVLPILIVQGEDDQYGTVRQIEMAQQECYCPVDVALFTQWVDAYARDETELADFYRKRFRPEFKPAFAAWVATRPRINPEAPLSPFAMPQYKLAANAKADRLEVQAGAASQRVGRFIQRADNYALAVVLFAASLFFAGISTRLRSSTTRMVVLGLGYALFLGNLGWIATFPVSVSV